MKLHVLTAVSRPRNIPKIAHSLLQWGDVDYEWHLRFDTEKRHVGGQAVKNAMLDSISDGWVFFLDDDTLAHPRLYGRIAELTADDGALLKAVVFNQDRNDGAFYPACPENVKVGSIDIGQAVFHHSLITDPIPEEYAGDGMFLEAMLDPRATLFLDEVLSYHNRLEKK